jgi:hypothetical protein
MACRGNAVVRPLSHLAVVVVEVFHDPIEASALGLCRHDFGIAAGLRVEMPGWALWEQRGGPGWAGSARRALRHAHAGLRAAIDAILIGAAWQRSSVNIRGGGMFPPGYLPGQDYTAGECDHADGPGSVEVRQECIGRVGPTRAPIAESQAEKARLANAGTERIACSPRSDRGGGHGASQEDAGYGSGYRYRSGMSADASSIGTSEDRVPPHGLRRT